MERKPNAKLEKMKFEDLNTLEQETYMKQAEYLILNGYVISGESIEETAEKIHTAKYYRRTTLS